MALKQNYLVVFCFNLTYFVTADIKLRNFSVFINVFQWKCKEEFWYLWSTRFIHFCTMQVWSCPRYFLRWYC